MNKILVLILIFISLVLPLQAQKTAYHLDNGKTFKDAKELFGKEKYSTAQKLFLRVYEEEKHSDSEIKTLSQYYIAQCAIRLFNADAEFYTNKFISENPGSPLVDNAYFSLGGYFYATKRWNDAVIAYNKADWRKLNNEEQSELFFKKGYSYFMLKKYDEAKLSFYEILEKDSKFNSPAVYYYSHIHYKEENYQTALNGFLKLKDDNTFGPIIPYYVVQIYYMQEKYEEIIEFVPGIIDNVTEKRLDEVSRITAEAFFKLEKYEDAIVYFEKYQAATSNPNPEATYQLAYSYYKTGKYDKAVSYFSKISHVSSIIGQSASYYLASCYIELDDKENARKAFSSAARTDYDPAIKQDAMFNYALVTYELGGDPLNDAINAFEEFINKYPESKRIDEARRMLIQAYLNSKNYKKALASIEKIDVKNDELKEAYQKIAFNRGIELFGNLKYRPSAEMFQKALKYKGINQVREARAAYWYGESLFRLELYDKSINAYKEFKNAPVAHTTEEYKMVNYSLAYAYYKKGVYKTAADYFRQFTSQLGDNIPSNYVADANLRIADCYFMNNDYYKAVDFYQKSIDSEVSAIDYAYLQKGMCLGLLKKSLDKIAALNILVTKYPGSVYADNAYYEIAQEYLKLQDSEQAITALTNLTTKYPNSELSAAALVQLGLLHYNAGNNELAIKNYKKTVSDFSGTPESRDALIGLKNIYIDLGRIKDYSDFVDGLEGDVPKLSVNEKDSLTYIAAEKYYMTSDCEKAEVEFKKYIKDYPQGAYLTNAHFYMGDCYYQSDKYEEALSNFDFVLKRPKNLFTEQALLGSARIAVKTKNNKKAAEFYSKLLSVSSSSATLKEARIGIMRADYELKDYTAAIESAKNVINISGLDENKLKEAKFIKARSLQESGRDALALEEFRDLSTEAVSVYGAQANFRVAEILYNKGELDNAEKVILEFSNKSTSHDYWVARSFILWADIFAKRDNYFQATETVQSIIDYYEDSSDGIIELAKSRKAEIEKMSQSNVEEDNSGDEINIERNR